MANYLGRNPAVGTQKLLDDFSSQFNGVLTTFDLRYNGLPTYPTLSASLIVSLGGVLQEPGQAYYVSSDKIVFSEPPLAGTECWVLLYSEFGAAKSGSAESALSATGFPIGFEDPLSNSEFSFDAPTRVFTLGPASPATEYVVWNQGNRQAISAIKTVTLPNTTGLYLIYLDGFFELQATTNRPDFSTQTPVAYVYYNANTGLAPFIAEERHGVTMDHATHEYLHLTRGAVIANGFGLTNFTTSGTGAADADAQIGLANGVFYDEDLRIAVTHAASPTPGSFEQILSPTAQIPVFFKFDGSGEWRASVASSYPLLQGVARPAYNAFSGGSWTTPDVTNNRFFNIWVVATNNVSAPIIAILGQNEYVNLGSAEAATFSALNLSNFPVIEFRPLHRLTFQASNAYTNGPKARLRSTADLRSFDQPSVPAMTVHHGALSGLSSDDHLQYLHVENTRSGITANIVTTGDMGSANMTLTGELRGPSTFVIDPAVVGDDTGLVRIKGDLEVLGATTTISSATLEVADKNIVLGKSASPTDALADGGGITLKGTTDKTINWIDATDAWTLSEHLDLAIGKEYRINGVKVLDATSLGTSVLITSANITDGTIVDADVNVSAAIAGTKISPDFGNQAITTNGSIDALSLASFSNLMIAFATRAASIGMPGELLFGVGPAVFSATPVGIGPHDYYPIDLASGSFM